MANHEHPAALTSAQSLLLRLAFAMGTITALAFVSMLSSVFFAEAMGGAAGAINHAGALRMGSYRIAARVAQGVDSVQTLALAAEFDSRLASARLTAALPASPQDEVRAAYAGLQVSWKERVRPALLSAPGDEAVRRSYQTEADLYVAQVDRFVGLLEQRTEAKVRWLRLIHIVSLFLTLSVVALTMYMMHTRVLLPLRELLACARRARRSDFSRRTPYETDDELGQLGRAFNAMAEDLSKSYADLECRVRLKTADLERSHRSLEFLYRVAVQLNEGPLSKEMLGALLRELDSALGVGTATICLETADGSGPYFFASGSGGVAEAGRACPGCAPETDLVGNGSGPTDCPRRGGSVFPIRDRDQAYGMLIVGSAPRPLDSWQSRLLEAVAAQIGTAITTSRRSEQSHRLSLFEERAVIARELHDSLAQSLSYLKIQTGRLDAALQEAQAGGEAQRVMAELREGLGSAYRQLRELLGTFRLRMDGRGLAPALRATVKEYEERSGIPIVFDCRMERCRLSPNEEIHVLQVVREALSNVVRHARASRATVALVYMPETGRLTVRIDDDGIGIPLSPLRAHHYGLAIMDERARSLGGELQVARRHEGGTRVELTFAPPAEDSVPAVASRLHVHG